MVQAAMENEATPTNNTPEFVAELRRLLGQAMLQIPDDTEAKKIVRQAYELIKRHDSD